MFHKIIQVIPKEKLIIEVEFDNGIKKIYDINKIINKWETFKDLKNEIIFKNVKVDIGGYGIIWNENIDLSSEEIWQNGQEI